VVGREGVRVLVRDIVYIAYTAATALHMHHRVDISASQHTLAS
jgi:hypothetical protein